MNKFLAQHLK